MSTDPWDKFPSKSVIAFLRVAIACFMAGVFGFIFAPTDWENYDLTPIFAMMKTTPLKN